jgi:hypothetical protein
MSALPLNERIKTMNSKKTRKALIGTFIGMMALTAASAATAGVAWFTTTRTAIVHFPNAAVSSNRGELMVGKLGQAPNVKEYAVDEAGFDSEMDALSSYDGVNFYNALLDVDGSEMGKFFKVEEPDVAEFGFSAGVQEHANTDLNIYLEEMEIKVVDDYGYETLSGDGTEVEFALSEEAAQVYQVKVGDKVLKAKEGETANDYDFDGTDTITFTVAPVAGTDNIEVIYQKAEEGEVAGTDPILNSIRVSLFASNTENTVETIAVEKNQTLVWDTTDNGEDHYGVTVTAEDATHTDEKHYVRKASERFIDLDYAIDANDTDEKITAITLKHGDAEPVDIASKVSVTGRRVTITEAELEIARGDLITVSYIADTVAKKQMPGNVASKIDGYYVGDDLKDTATDGDLTAYGAYLGETTSGNFLNVVARIWIEGTDEDHDEIGDNARWSEYLTKDSIDLEFHNYKVAMDLHLDAIDANIA